MDTIASASTAFYHRLQALLDATENGILLIEPSGQVEIANAKFGELFELDPTLLIGQDHQRVVREQLVPLCRDPDMLGWRLPSPTATHESEIELAEPLARVLHRYTGPVRDEHGQAVGRIDVYRDITARRRADQELVERNRQLSVLNAVAAVVSQSLDLDTMLDDTLRAVLRLTAFDVGAVLLAEPQTGQLALAAHVDLPQALLDKGERLRFGVGLTGLAFAQGTIMLSEDLRQDERALWREDLSHLSLAAVACVPLKARDRTLGVMTLMCRAVRRFSPHEVSLLEAIGNQVGVAVDHALLFREAERRAEELVLLNQSTQQITATLDLDGILRLSVEKLAELLRFDRCLLLTYASETDELVGQVGYGLPDVEVVALRQPLSELPIAQRALAERQVLVADGYEGLPPEYVEFFGFRTVACTPLVAKDTVIGVVLADHGGQPFDLDRAERALCLSFASQAAVAITNSQLFEQTSEERAILDAVMHSMGEALLLVDSRGEVVYCNRQAEELLGIKAPEVIGCPADHLLNLLLPQVAQPGPVGAEWRRALEQPDNLPLLEVVVLQPAARILQFKTFPIFDEGGQRLGCGQVGRDITREREADKLKTDLISTVSHELRTPITLIKGYASMLLKKPEGGHLPEYLQIIDWESDRLRELLDNLLEVSKIEAGVLAVEKQPVQLGLIIHRAIREARLLAGGRTIDLRLPPGLPLVDADPGRIEQVLSNLLRNAIKYTGDDGHIVVEAELRETGVLVRVRDDGIGIPGEDWERVFERHYRVPNPVNARERGSGLGLAICKGVVETHGGTIWAESDPETGTSLAFTLPLAAAQRYRLGWPSLRASEGRVVSTPERQEAAPARVAAPVAAGSDTVLVVDDDPGMVRFIRAQIEAAGFRTLSAGDGQTALRLVQRERPGLLLLDIALPVMDGYELCRQVRAFSSVPIIMLTGQADERAKVRALDLGADDYLTKPFAADELLARVRALLRRSRGVESLPQSFFVHKDLAIDFAQRKVTVRGRAVELSGTDYKLLHELAINAGRVLSHRELLNRVWGSEYRNESGYLWVYIHRLRRKLEKDPTKPEYILTQPGVGYLFAAS